VTIASAVLVPVYRDEAGDLRVVLVVRGGHGVHGGQVGLPGGIKDQGDVDLEATALREAEEEIGLTRGSVDVLQALPEVEVPTGYVITPFLARLSAIPPVWKRQEREIAEILSVAVADLARNELRGEEVWQLQGGPRRTTFVRLGPHKLWGATYRILNPLVPRLLAGEWPL